MLSTDTPRRVTACYLPKQGARVCIGGQAEMPVPPTHAVWSGRDPGDH
jgi:hypothetical protein